MSTTKRWQWILFLALAVLVLAWLRTAFHRSQPGSVAFRPAREDPDKVQGLDVAHVTLPDEQRAGVQPGGPQADTEESASVEPVSARESKAIMEPGPVVQGRVTTQDGAPVHDAVVSVSSEPGSVVRTNVDGVYRISPKYGLLNCRAVVASHPEFVTASVPLEARPAVESGTRDVRVDDVVLHRGKLVVVSVFDGGGAFIEGAHVSLSEAGEFSLGKICAFVNDIWETDRGANGGGLLVASGRTDPTGIVELHVPAGLFILQVRANGYVPVLDRDVSVPSELDQLSIDVVLDEGNSLYGRVIDIVDGLPIHEARVVVWTGDMLLEQETDLDGNFTRNGIPTDRTRVELLVLHPSYAPAWLRRCAVYERHLIELESAPFRLRLVDALTGEELRGAVRVTVGLAAEYFNERFLASTISPDQSLELHEGSLSILVGRHASHICLEQDEYEREVIDVSEMEPGAPPRTVRMRPVQQCLVEVADAHSGRRLRAELVVQAYVPGPEQHWVESKRQFALQQNESPGLFKIRSDELRIEEGARLAIRHSGYKERVLEYKEPGVEAPRTRTVYLEPLE